MKKSINFLFTLIISLNAFTQISTNEIPFSFKEKFENGNIPRCRTAAARMQLQQRSVVK